MRSLVPCPQCGRHVFAGDATCPFCAVALPDDLDRFAIPGTTRRLTRAAAFAFTASLSLAGCSSSTDSTGSADAGRDGSSVDGSTSDGGGITPAYGAPVDGGNIQPLYGMPADAGPEDSGGGQVLYGLPPPDAGSD
ncbi:MAG: hypothetical protein U0235_04900 [Polyangiaceae bacterium]